MMSMTVFRHVVSGVFPGESWSCTLHTTGALTADTANTAWEAAWTLLWNGVAAPADDVKHLVPTIVECTEATTATLDAVTFKQVTKSAISLSLFGTDAGASLPPQDTVVVSWTSAMATKGGRGRMFLPVFGADQTANGRLSTAARGVCALAASAMCTSLKGSGLTPVLFNRKTGVTTNMTGGSIGDVIDTQRRRRQNLTEVRTTFLF